MPVTSWPAPPPTSRRRFLTLAAVAAAAAACGRATAAGGAETKKLRYQGWVGQVTLPELAEDLGYFGDVKLEWVGNTISGPQDIQSAATGQTDFGGAFNGAVVKLIAAGAPVKAAISYYGVDAASYNGYYVLEDSPIRSARDLVGKKVGMNTLGAHVEAVLDTYLQRNGFAASELRRVERIVVPPVNTEQALRQKQIEVASLGGVLRDKALAAGGIRPLFSDFDLLGAFSAGDVRADRQVPQPEPDHVEGLRHGGREGDRVGPDDAARGGDRPEHGHHQAPWPQRGRRGAPVLEVLRRRRARRPDHGPDLPALDRLADRPR